MNRIELFQNALSASEDALARAPYMFTLNAVISQLEYLIDLERGEGDPGKLGTINLGAIAARDIDTFDANLANLLHDASAEARKMADERR